MPNGGVIGKANVPSSSVASGVWSLRRLFSARVAGIWPSIFVPNPASSVEYLVVAGGGGGRLTFGPGGRSVGGGGGGYRNSFSSELSGANSPSESPLVVSPSTLYLITVGAGGAELENGLNSIFATVESVGGGGGSISFGPYANGKSGGSGSGGWRTGVGGAGTSGQGSNGGNGFESGSGGLRAAGGGGGAGGNGGNAKSNTGGSRGLGLSSSITGSAVTRAGGGQGGSTNVTGGQAGAPNTGTGGDGSSDFASGGLGGSGVVIVRYADTFQDLQIGAGLTYRDYLGNTNSGQGTRVLPSYTPSGFKVYEFRSGTGNVEF